MVFGGSQLRESSASFANPARASEASIPNGFWGVRGKRFLIEFERRSDVDALSALSEPSIPNGFWGRGIREAAAGFAKLPRGSNTKYS